MPTYLPAHEPHTPHNAPKYWHGVGQILEASQYAEAPIGQRPRPRPADVLPPQPPVSTSASVQAWPLDQPWRADQAQGARD